MARDFYPFVEETEKDEDASAKTLVTAPARIAVYDDAAAAPRVVVVEPKDVRDYLEEITGTVNKLSHEQGGTIPFMVIREIVENFIHAYFQAPTITILDGGNTIRFSDQGPGIREKDLALEYGTSSATEEMRQYIRGVGSGLPYAQQYMEDKGGSLTIEDNIQGGTVVTISIHPKQEAADISRSPAQGAMGQPGTAGAVPPAAQVGVYPAGMPAQQAWQQAAYNPYAQPQQPLGYDQFGQPIYAQPSAWPQQQAGFGQAAAYVQQAGAGAAGAAPQQPYQPQPFMQGAQAPQGQPAWQPPAGAAQAPQPMGAPQPWAAPTGMPQQAAGPAATPQLSERGQMVLDYLAQHESCGPTELVRAYGLSGPTWSRELQSLVAAGFVMKTGQKHQLTALGRGFI